MAKIFISYRRDDSQYQADRLHNAIAPYVSDPKRDIFIDIDNIPLGVNFAAYLDEKVGQCEVLLALIGPGWLEATDEAGNRRLDRPDDFVRIEIASALRRGIPVVPVLLDRVSVPRADQLPEDLKELALRNGVELQRNTFEDDVGRLVRRLGVGAEPPPKKGNLAIAAAIAIVLAASAGAFYSLDPMGLFTLDVGQDQALVFEDVGDDVPPVTPIEDGAKQADTVPEQEPETAPGDASTIEAQVQMDPRRTDAIRGLQRALNALGLYTSVIDGDPGPGTGSAVSRFASDFGGNAPELETAWIPDIIAFTARVEREVIAARQRDEDAWRAAHSRDSNLAYRVYLSNFPNGAYASAARSRIEAMARPEAATYEVGHTFRNTLSGGGRGPEMVVVPLGAFTMGSPTSEAGRGADEGPQRTVRIDYKFAVGKYEVTWAEWEACVADGGCNQSSLDTLLSEYQWATEAYDWGRGNRPVIMVSWNDAQAYVAWLSRKTGERYRLLSEAEWEYVARAGKTTRFSWGDGDPTCFRGATDGANFGSCSRSRTEPVGFSAPNAFDLYDLHGNVWEWVEDCGSTSYVGAPANGSAWTSSDCSLRVLRGGSWVDFSRALRSTARLRIGPSVRSMFTGFRVASDLEDLD